MTSAADWRILVAIGGIQSRDEPGRIVAAGRREPAKLNDVNSPLASLDLSNPTVGDAEFGG